MDGSGNVDPGTHATSVDILGISKRLQRLPNWKSDIEEIRDRMMKESRKQGMAKSDAQQWTYSELDRLYPPAETPADETATPNAQRGAILASGGVRGLGDIPEGWPELPDNASLAAEIGWVQAQRLRIVEEKPGGATVVHLDRARSPAPSWAALGWLETSVRSYAKYVDAVAKSLGTQQDEAALVRRERMKSELPPRWDGTPRFPNRTLVPIEVDYTDDERELHANLRQYSKLRQKNVSDNAERFACEFVLKTLKKRLFSSPHAFKTTLEQHEQSLKNARKRGAKVETSPGILQRQLDRAEEEFANDDEYEEATDDALEVAGRLFRDSTDEEQNLLKKMKAWAAKAAVRANRKTDQLFRWLNEHIKPNGKWCRERVIIFTEYRATQNMLQTLLAAEGFGGDRLATMYGGMDPKQR